MELPNKIPFEVTVRCNCRCKMCRFWGIDSPTQKFEEMSFEEIQKALKKIKECYSKKSKSVIIGLTGGEPFMRSELLKIIREIKKLGMSYDIVSNFALPDEQIIKELSKTPPLELNISLDGVGKVHNAIRGAEIFDKVLENILLMKKYSPQTHIKLDCTITKRNLKDLVNVYYFAKNYGLRLNYRHLNFVSPKQMQAQEKLEKKLFGKVFTHNPSYYTLNKKEVSLLKKEVSKIRKLSAKDNFTVTFLPELNKNINNWYENPSKTLSKGVCDINKIRLKPDGSIVHCENYVYGNILKDDLCNIYETQAAKKFIKVLKDKHMPFCNRCCFPFFGYSEK